MAKIVAICGSPASGKTTTGLKIAQEAYFFAKFPVLFISPDTNTPTLAYFFPRSKDAELFSLSSVLDKTSITSEDILRQTVTIGTMKDFGILGLKTGENKYSFPRPTEEKIKDFFIALNGTASTVFIDCTSCFDDHISEAALRYSDVVIQIISPDIRSMAYYSAYEEKYNTISNKCIKVINTLDNDLFLPINEVKTHFKGVDFIVPFSHELKQQAITGTLIKSIKDSKYKFVCRNIARMVLDNDFER